MSQKAYSPLLKIEEVLPILNRISIFGGLTDKHLYEIFKLLKTVSYDPGEYIYKRGEAPSHIYIIRQGEVKIAIDSKDVSLELITFVTGDCFGETSVIGIQGHTASALSVTSTELLVLERGALLNIFDMDKELFGLLILNIARETSRRLHKADDEILRLVLGKGN